MNAVRNCVTLSAAALLCGCAGASMHSAYSEPHVAFVSEHRMGTQGVLPAIVRKIDGRAVIEGRSDPVKPGVHAIEVSVSGMAEGNPKTVSVDAKPCMRYYLGAKRDPATGQIAAQVTATEPIKECSAK